MSDEYAMEWGGFDKGRMSLQKFAEEGVAYFTKFYGYSPTHIEYREEDGSLDIPGISCISRRTNVRMSTVLIYPAKKRS